MNEPKGEGRGRPGLRLLLLVLKIMVSTAALLWLFSVIRWDILADTIGKANWLLAGISFMAGMFWIVPCALRWRQLLRRCGYVLGAKEALHAYFVGTFFNSFLPTDKGGDVVRAVLTARRKAFPVSSILGTILIERLNGLQVVLGWIFFVSLFFVPQPGLRQSICISTAAAFALLTVLMRLISRPGCWRLIRRLPFPRLLAALDNALEVWRRCRQDARTMRVVTAYSLLNLLLVVLAAWIQGQAISGFNAPAFSFALVVPLTFVAGLLPSIGGYGVKEAGLIIGFGWFGVSPESAALFVIFQLATRWLMAAAGAVIFVTSRERETGAKLPVD